MKVSIIEDWKKASEKLGFKIETDYSVKLKK